MRWREAIVPVLLGTIVASGCYRYVPQTRVPDPGTRVSVVLTDRATVDLAPLVGPSIGVIEGRLVAADTGALTLAVALVRRHDGVETLWRGEHVTVPRDGVASLGRRAIAPGRTALLAGSVVAGALVAARGFGGGLAGAAPRGGGGGSR